MRRGDCAMKGCNDASHPSHRVWLRLAHSQTLYSVYVYLCAHTPCCYFYLASKQRLFRQYLGKSRIVLGKVLTMITGLFNRTSSREGNALPYTADCSKCLLQS